MPITFLISWFSSQQLCVGSKHIKGVFAASVIVSISVQQTSLLNRHCLQMSFPINTAADLMKMLCETALQHLQETRLPAFSSSSETMRPLYQDKSGSKLNHQVTGCFPCLK